ncbi:NADH-quinone oxidoreductase subunit H [Frigoribacterium sp. PhB24]|uniref:NADH-quinone oxidoreductase subunit H n=1 Tax=Frigoribacterium sp. PhB24 TaxID=2485204 RepID=UPI000F4AD6DA|nr:NADH-quinone oxidoreductase subunit H [Frigoribacterium sp. PhB24]ROS49696.1 NADH dehydrogenase subunit H [Frigoribacterium sp. PhB24]
MVDIESTLWALVLPVVVVVLAITAASGNAVLVARDRGTPVSAAVLSPFHETHRLLRQQRRSVLGADTLLWRIGGSGLIVAAFLAALAVPVGNLTPLDVPVGVVWFNAVDVTLWALWWLLGWGSNSVHPLIGGYRFLAQALAYEIPLMFALTAPAIGAQSLRLTDVVSAQEPIWFAVTMPVAFVVYCASVTAFSAWGPFALPAGTDIAGGVLGELSGVDRLLVLAGRWCLLVAGAAFAVPMFLGGGAGPLLPPALWVLVKTCALLAVFLLLGRAMPAVRPQRLAEIGWVVVLPLVLLQLLVTSVLAVTGN